MPIQVARVISEVRRILQDTDTDKPRHLDQPIRSAMSLAVQDMRRLRPDVFLHVYTLMPDPLTANEMDIEDMFLSPLTMLTVGYVAMASNEYNLDQSAANFIGLGRAQLAG